MEGQDFFKKVFPDTQRDKILQDFVHSGHELYTKIVDNKFLILQPYLLKKDSIICRALNENILGSSKKWPASPVHNFILNGDRYYFQGTLTFTNNQYEVALPQELYQLQRRQSYRVRIPEHLVAAVETRSIDGRPVVAKGPLLDLSLGGCSFELPLQEKLANDTEVIFDIYLNKTLFFPATARVRRSQYSETPRGLRVFAGVEFSNLTPAMEQKIFNLTLDIHRDTYGRLI